MMNPGYRCRICQSADLNSSFVAREMMYGTREEFSYDICNYCESVQISTIPSDMTKYYADNYYSMKVGSPRKNFSNTIKDCIISLRDSWYFGSRNILGFVISRIKAADGDLIGISKAAPALTNRILDVGCGERALLLHKLARIGFADIQGIDPFLSAAVREYDGFNVVKGEISDLTETFDVITLNHSFEHVPDPRRTMSELCTLLKEGGRLVIRIPTPSSDAFVHYGPNWVQLDAPRHLNLPSRKGMKILAEGFGLKILSSTDDSSSFQFVGSDLYRKDIPLLASHASVSRHKKRSYEALARKLNRCERGDQVAFVMRKLN